MSAGKGSGRRKEDAKAVRERWPYDEPSEVSKRHKAHLRRLKGKDKNDILNREMGNDA